MLQDECPGQPVLQAMPQSTEHFAWAAYNNDTPCSAVLEPTTQTTSYDKPIKLEFTNTSSLAVQGITYHVCSDVTWPKGYAEIGPVDTFLWFYNPCNTAATIRFNVSRLAHGA